MNFPKMGRHFLNEPSEEYKTGFPDKPGWYDVMVEGVELRLCFRFCPSCGTHVWQDLTGNKTDPSLVTFIPESHSLYP